LDKLQFFMPVRIVVAPDKPVEEVYGLNQALDFLISWPSGRQGPVYQTALNACLAASVDEVSTEDARRAFISFARITNILAKDAPNAVILTSDGDLRPLPK
jgi:hypothetical protein